MVPTVNRASATVTTKVRILDKDAGVLPDMSARVSFLSRALPPAADKPVLAVSAQAIVQRDGHAVVFAIGEDGRAHALPVTAGVSLGDVRAVTGALKIGQALVQAPGAQLRDGSPLQLPEAR